MPQPTRLAIRWSLGFAVLGALMTLWLLAFPFDFESQPVSGWLESQQFRKINTASNIMLFLPLGIVGGWFIRLWLGHAAGLLLVVLYAMAVSLVGETMQMYLPTRNSSIADLIANTVGGSLGAMIGYTIAPALTRAWLVVERIMLGRPHLQMTVLIILAVMAIRAAPFDLSLERRHLGVEWRETISAGLPFENIYAVYVRGSDHPVQLDRARDEVIRATANVTLFALSMAIMLGIMVREAWSHRDVRTMAQVGLCIGIGLVCVTELMQGPIRSRTMDATDLAAGCAGVFVGVGVGMLVGHWRIQSRIRRV